MAKLPVSLAVTVSIAALCAATFVPAASAAEAQTTSTKASTALRRPVALPLLPGMTGGEVLGGRGDRLLLGSVVSADGSRRPVEWRRRATGWSIVDLSGGGVIGGEAESQDRRGDILINDGSTSQAWVRTPDGTLHPVAADAQHPGGVFARQMSDQGEIVGAVFGPAPDYLSAGAVWRHYSSPPQLKDPLPFTASADSLLLGINDHGATVGNSDNADYSDFAGGVWRPGAADGSALPGVGGGYHTFPTRINDTGLSVGEAQNADFSVDGAGVWFGRRLRFLGAAVPSDTSASFYGLSEDDRAVGVSAAPNNASARVIYWHPGLRRLRVLPPLVGSWQEGTGNAHYVSDTGLVGGDSLDAAGDDLPVVWTHADRQAIVP